MRYVRTRHGARIEQDGLIVSEVLRRPGPTHTLFDVLAACMAALAPGARAAVLGFAAGGIVAPLRAMGYGHPLAAVDLSLDGERLFRELSTPWAGQVRVERGEASAWLRTRRTHYDVVLEDLSAMTPRGVTKPDVSLEVLPALMRRRLTPRGLVVLNVLPVPGWSWRRLLAHLAAPYARAQVLVLEEWENRVLLLGDRLEPARTNSHRVRASLRAIGSEEAGAFSLRRLRARDRRAARRPE
jgi:hypothetical protein